MAKKIRWSIIVGFLALLVVVGIAFAISIYRARNIGVMEEPAAVQNPAPDENNNQDPTSLVGGTQAGSDSQNGQIETGSESAAAIVIKVLAPKEGDVFTSQMEPIDFSWSWSGVGKTVAPLVQLINERGEEVYGKLGGSGTSYSENGGQGQIPAPASLAIPDGSAKYRVRICTSRAKTDCGQGDYFTIVKTAISAADQKITIQVTAPKSGEALETGRQYTIKWKNSGLPAGSIQTIMVMRGTKGVVEEPNITIASGLPMNINSYTWKVGADDGWRVGERNDLWREFARFLGVETAHADLNQYVIRISANAPGVLGEVGLGISDPFTINQPELEKACTDAGGTWDEPNVLCDCPKHYYWYPGHGCLLDQGEQE